MQKKEILMENLQIKILVLEMKDQNIKQVVVDNKTLKHKEVSKIKKVETEIML
jgi:hypothetical protein